MSRSRDAALSDDFVAEILKKEAEKQNQQGRFTPEQPFLFSSRRRARPDGSKPNTRFLRNLIRETDSHNASLRAREQEDSSAKLRGLKRQREEPDKDDRSRRMRDGDRRRKHDGPGRQHQSSFSTSAQRKNIRHREDSPRSKHRSSRTRLRSPRRRSDRDDSDIRARGRDQRRRHHSPTSQPESPTGASTDSDPLDDIIGPRPPPKTAPRGRGAYKDADIDGRFRPDYDPTTDVSLPADEKDDDWDTALEAYRDRAKWRQSGAERLRAAGFSERDVTKWQGGGGKRDRDDGVEKDAADVKWAKKGEGREWDRGKVLDGGRIDVKASWAV